MKSCVPYGKYILAVFVMRKIKKIAVFLMINSMCSLCRIRYGNFFVFVVDGVQPHQLLRKPIIGVGEPCWRVFLKLVVVVLLLGLLSCSLALDDA